jgi:hypothetical protein
MPYEMSPPDSRNDTAATEPSRAAIRLLFPGFLFCAVFLLVIRSLFGEPYPGPFMPAFSGNGLRMISPNEAAVILPKLTVGFSDQSEAEISMDRLFADGPVSSHRAMLFLIAPDPDIPPPRVGMKARVHQWLAIHLPGYHETYVNTKWDVPDDVRSYLDRRLVKLYPLKTPTTLTIAVNQYQFSPADFHKPKTVPVSQKTIVLHDGA